MIALVLAMASATAVAQPGPGPAPVATGRAQDTERTLEAEVRRLTTHWTQLTSSYRRQLEAIDRLKKQRSSWRQQRALKDQLASANDTAKQLASASAELTLANTRLATARRTLLAAIDAEMAAGATGPRAAELTRVRARLAPAVTKARVARIVLPELEVDPLADPEELEEQGRALADSEAQLRSQIADLERQTTQLEQVARLRSQHERAGDLARRDDDQPQRSASQGTRTLGSGTAAEGASAPEVGAPPSDGGDGTGLGTGVGGGRFEAEATIVLAEVVDATTIESLTRAQRSGDPAQRAAAARRARDAVAARLAQLQKKRAEIQRLLHPR